MTQLILGMGLFIAIHLLPSQISFRQNLIDKMGRVPYLALFSLISVIGFILIVNGFGMTSKEQIWQPQTFARPLAHAIMPLVFILLISAYLNTHIRAKLKHPMLIATSLWALVHLLANGDLASAILFGGFLLYALADMLLAKPRESLVPKGQPKAKFDVIAVVVGLMVYALVLRGHQTLFGVAVFGS
ncbi:NnrU family protein [Shewanella atlantica]|uniref:NnrU family protein n=1 Tax=Shewanella atlantica TaxID=271099 RepID=UPI00373547DE